MHLVYLRLSKLITFIIFYKIQRSGAANVSLQPMIIIIWTFLLFELRGSSIHVETFVEMTFVCSHALLTEQKAGIQINIFLYSIKYSKYSRSETRILFWCTTMRYISSSQFSCLQQEVRATLVSRIDMVRTGIASTKGSGNANTRNVYADGSTIRNGKTGAKSGTGTYFSAGSRFNSSSGSVSGAQSNTRSEAAAVKNSIKAITREVASGSGSNHYTVRTDSKHAIGGTIVLYYSTIERTDRDISQSISDLSDNLYDRGVRVCVSYIPGHSGHPGNEAADALARDAAYRK